MTAPATMTLFDDLYADDGSVLANATVTCTLNSTLQTSTGGGLVTANKQTATTNSAGRFSFTVVASDLLSPSGSAYILSVPAIGRTWQAAPQSANGTSQRSTAGNVLVSTPQTLAPAGSLSGLYAGPADLAVGSVTVKSSSPYTNTLPGNAAVTTPGAVITGNLSPWQWGSGVYSVRAAGALGDGTTNDDAAFTLAAQAAALWVSSSATVGNRATIYVPQATEAYLLGGTVGNTYGGPFTGINMSGITIRGDGTRVRLSTAAGLSAAYCFRFDHGTSSAPDSNIWIDGIYFDGQERNATYGTPIYATENANPTRAPIHTAIYGIWIDQIKVTNCTFYDFGSTALWLPYGGLVGFENYDRLNVEIDKCFFYQTAQWLVLESGSRGRVNIIGDTPLCTDATYLMRAVTLNFHTIRDWEVKVVGHGGGRSSNLAVASGVAAGTTSVTIFPVGLDLPPGTIVWDSGQQVWLGYGQTNAQLVTLSSAVHVGDTTISFAAITPTINFPIGAAVTPEGGRFGASYTAITVGSPVILEGVHIDAILRGWNGLSTGVSNSGLIQAGNNTPATLGQQGQTTLSVATGTSGGTTAITVNALPTAVKNRQALQLVSGATQQTVFVNNTGGYAAGSTAITVTSFTPSINFPIGSYVQWGASGETTIRATIDDSTAWFGIGAKGNTTVMPGTRISRMGGVGYYDAGTYNKAIGVVVRAGNTQQFSDKKRCAFLLGSASPDAVDHPTVQNCQAFDDGVQQNMYAIGTGLGAVTNAYIIGNDFSGCVGVDGNNFNAAVCKGTAAEVRNNKGWNPVGAVTTPAFPATTVGAQNTTGHDVKAMIVNGVNTMTYTLTGPGLGTVTSRTIPANAYIEVMIPAQQTFTPTYGGGAPVWTWYGL